MAIFMRMFYTLLFTVLLPFILVKILIRNVNDRHGYRKSGPRYRLFERFGWLFHCPPAHGIVIHAVSVGESMAAKEFIDACINQYPNTPVIVTTTTPTGSNLIRNHLGNRVYHCYLPFDLPIFIHFFLYRLRPQAIVFIETEMWPNLLNACQQRNIICGLVSARLSDSSFNGYRRFFPLANQMLSAFDFVACQTEADAERFKALGLPGERCKVTGNIKADIRFAPENNITQSQRVLDKAFGTSNIILAVSTHEGEELMCIDAFIEILERFPNTKLVIAPRHPSRVDSLMMALKDKIGSVICRHSQNSFDPERHSVYIVDTIGELPYFYQKCRLCFVGGSLIAHGGHNPLEPAAFKKPILSGPYVKNFAAIFQQLSDRNAVIMLANAAELAYRILQILEQQYYGETLGENAYHFLLSQKGASLRSLQLLDDRIFLPLDTMPSESVLP